MWPLVALNVLGGVMRANAARRAAQAQAQQDEFNAQIDEHASADAIARGQVAEGGVRRATSEAIGNDRSQYGASGVDVQSGSVLDVLAGQRARGELAALTVRSNATREAWGYAGQAQNFRNRGDYALQSGNDAFLAGIIGAAGSGAELASRTGMLVPGVTAPLIRVGEPTEPPPLMPGRYPLSGWNSDTPLLTDREGQ